MIYAHSKVLIIIMTVGRLSRCLYPNFPLSIQCICSVIIVLWTTIQMIYWIQSQNLNRNVWSNFSWKKTRYKLLCSHINHNTENITNELCSLLEMLPVFGQCCFMQPSRKLGLPMVPFGHSHKYLPGKFVQLPKQLSGSAHSSMSNKYQCLSHRSKVPCKGKRYYFNQGIGIYVPWHPLLR